MRDRLIQLIALIVLATGVLFAFMLTPTINDQRVQRQLTYDVRVGDDTNPMYTTAEVMGSFRGILINVMWQRSEALKREGKFFEANHLAEQITTLQPRYPEAWNFQAWNMAYNISVKCKTAEERWDWVDKGLTLLRDRGIPNNPNAVVLYRSLAWILGHKMTGQTDDMHNYYKARMAERWQVLLGMPDEGWVLKPEFRGENQPTRETFDPLIHIDWLATKQFEAVSDSARRYLRKPDVPAEDYNPANYFDTLSPDALARFYADNPGLEAFIRELQTVTDDAGEPLGLGLNTKTLKAIGRLDMFTEAGYPLDSPAVNSVDALGADAIVLRRWINANTDKYFVNTQPRINVPAVRERLADERPEVVVVDLVPMINFLRAQTLVADYHMDPAFMLKIMQDFGPMDWRHPASHAVYWTSLGTLRAETWTLDSERIDFINANRSIIHSLQHLAHNGKINYRPSVAGLGPFGIESISHTPDTRMIPAYDRAWREVMDKIESGAFGDRVRTDTYRDGHENFLQSAVYLYYFEGNQNMAQRYYDRVRELYAQREDSVDGVFGEYNLSLQDFAIVRMEDELGYQSVANINFWIRFAWQHGLEQRSRAVMNRYLNTAKQRYDDFLEDRQTVARGETDVLGRQALPPFENLVLQQLMEMMVSSEFSLLQKSRIWELSKPLLASRSTESPLVYQAYAALRPVAMRQIQIEQWNVPFATAFSEPEGFSAWFEQAVGQPVAPSPLRQE